MKNQYSSSDLYSLLVIWVPDCNGKYPQRDVQPSLSQRQGMCHLSHTPDQCYLPTWSKVEGEESSLRKDEWRSQLERLLVFNAMETVTVVKKKADWALKVERQR